MEGAPHVPVLLTPLLAACAPVRGVWLDGTFGAGGYARGLLAAGAERVVGVDRDPEAHRLAAGWLAGEPGIDLRLGTFGELDRLAAEAELAGGMQMKQVADNLRNLARRAPQTMHEAMQLIFIFYFAIS